MSDASVPADQIGKLVCDAVVCDPPQYLNNNTSDEQHLSQDQTNKKEPHIPIVEEDDSSTSNSKGKTNDCKYSKSKKKSKSKTSNNTTINLNFVGATNLTIGPKTKHTYHVNNIQVHDCAPVNKGDKEKPKRMLPHIQVFSNNQMEITNADILYVKPLIGEGWKDMAKKIGFIKGQIEQFSKKYKHKGIGEIVYHILLDWKQSCTKDATIGRLINAMWLAKEYDCVEKWVENMIVSKAVHSEVEK